MYTSLIGAAAKVGDISRIWKLYDQLLKQGVPATAALYKELSSVLQYSQPSDKR
jgi:pentatricopeptide repeat protein